MQRNWGLTPRISEKTDSDGSRILAISLRIIIIFGVVAAFIFLVMVKTGYAHMHDRADLNDWFSSLSSQGGSKCCDDSEGTSLKDVDWTTTDVDKCLPTTDEENGAHVPVHYCVRLVGKWWRVPDRAVVIAPNLFGAAVVWPLWFGDGIEPHQRLWIRCFLRSSES